MRAVVQRVLRASVTIRETGERRAIGPGLVVLLGVGHADTPDDARWLAGKIVGLRLFEDEAGKMNVSLEDLPGAGLLVVSQFTLLGDARKGRRPSFTDAAPPAVAEPLYRLFVETARARGIPTQTGEFGAAMQVELVNDGPVTLIVDTPPR